MSVTAPPARHLSIAPPAWSAGRDWFAVLAVGAFAAEPIFTLLRDGAAAEQGVQGAIVLATGIWLLCREIGTLTAAPGHFRIALAMTAVAVLGYLAGLWAGLPWLTLASVHGAVAAVLYERYGPAVRRLWFPFVYLMLLAPLPYAIMGPISHATKLWLSTQAVTWLGATGFDVARTGNTLYIDQYELLVANACAGFSTLQSVLAVGLFYVYLRHRTNLRHALLLSLLTVPLVMFANLARVIAILWLTHMLGDAAAQGPLHEVTGLLAFLLVLVLLLLVDAVFARRNVRC